MSGVTDNERTEGEWREIAEAFLDAWWEWQPGDPTEALDVAASRAMTLRGDTLTLVQPEPAGERTVGTGPTAAEHADTIKTALIEFVPEDYDEDDPKLLVALAALVALADRKEVGRLWDDEVCACLLETGERQVEIVERCVRCGALMRSDAYHDGVALAARQQELLANGAEIATHYMDTDGRGDLDGWVDRARAALADVGGTEETDA